MRPDLESPSRTHRESVSLEPKDEGKQEISPSNRLIESLASGQIDIATLGAQFEHSAESVQAWITESLRVDREAALHIAESPEGAIEAAQLDRSMAREMSGFREAFLKITESKLARVATLLLTLNRDTPHVPTAPVAAETMTQANLYIEDDTTPLTIGPDGREETKEEHSIRLDAPRRFTDRRDISGDGPITPLSVREEIVKTYGAEKAYQLYSQKAEEKAGLMEKLSVPGNGGGLSVVDTERLYGVGDVALRGHIQSRDALFEALRTVDALPTEERQKKVDETIRSVIGLVDVTIDRSDELLSVRGEKTQQLSNDMRYESFETMRRMTEYFKSQHIETFNFGEGTIYIEDIRLLNRLSDILDGRNRAADLAGQKVNFDGFRENTQSVIDRLNVSPDKAEFGDFLVKQGVLKRGGGGKFSAVDRNNGLLFFSGRHVGAFIHERQHQELAERESLRHVTIDLWNTTSAEKKAEFFKMFSTHYLLVGERERHYLLDGPLSSAAEEYLQARGNHQDARWKSTDERQGIPAGVDMAIIANCLDEFFAYSTDGRPTVFLHPGEPQG